MAKNRNKKHDYSLIDTDEDQELLELNRKKSREPKPRSISRIATEPLWKGPNEGGHQRRVHDDSDEEGDDFVLEPRDL